MHEAWLCSQHFLTFFLLRNTFSFSSFLFPCCRGWMWAHSDVSRQWDAGIQELSWDIPKLHSLWKENPSASRKTPDFENWRPGYWITEMRVQLPYHPELFNIAWYVRDKAVVDAWTGKSVSERQLNKMQEMSAFVLSSSFLYSSVLSCCVQSCQGWGCCTGAARLWHSSLEGSASRPAGLVKTITANHHSLVQQVHRPVSALLPSHVGKELPHKWDKDEKLESVILCVSIPRQSMVQRGDNLYYC